MSNYLRRQPGPGMTAGNMRANGVRNLSVGCRECHHETLFKADILADEVQIHSIEDYLTCSRCGSRGKTDVMPNWSERPERPSLTGVQYRD
jgi:hypothetical protein